MEVEFPGAPPMGPAGRTTFEWMTGERFVIQRWEVPIPEAPDGLAVIAADESRGGYAQHYFDSRGVARLYDMTFADGLWTLTRTSEDFSPLDFSQRYSGTLSGDGRLIDGRWEISRDATSWELDFRMKYLRIA